MIFDCSSFLLVPVNLIIIENKKYLMKNASTKQLCLSCVLILVFFVGCATAPKMNRLSVGMSKSEVFSVMGSPSSAAAPGNGVEILRYELSPTYTAAWYGITQEYFVRITNGRVDSYGKMGDFNSTKDPNLNISIKNK